MKEKDNDTRGSQAVSHPSTNLAQRCLTSGIRRELVFSTWYGRCRDKSWKFAYLKDKPTKIVEKLLEKDNDTRGSQAVSHPSTNLAQCCLTSVIRRELVFSAWYGRCHTRPPIFFPFTQPFLHLRWHFQGLFCPGLQIARPKIGLFWLNFHLLLRKVCKTLEESTFASYAKWKNCRTTKKWQNKRKLWCSLHILILIEFLFCLCSPRLVC